MIDVRGLPKAAVLAALYNAARPLGLGWLHADHSEMTHAEAESLIAGRDSAYFDYVKGRPLKVTIDGREFEPSGFDRDHGQGSAKRAIDALRAAIGDKEATR